MFQSWRLKVREADEALKAGRLEESRRLIAEGDLVEYLPGKRLAARLATRLIDRARQHAQSGDWESGCRDLETALTLTDETNDLVAVRQALIAAAIRESENRLRRGDAAGALELIGKLESKKVETGSLRTLREIARRLESAKNLCRRGRFADAEAQLATAVSLRSDIAELEQEREACRGKLDQARSITDKLHQALGDSNWNDAAGLADKLLALAPESRLAKDARRRAWAEVGANLPDSRRFSMTRSWSPSRGGSENSEETPQGPRFLLWVDGVGGYLVCLSDEVVLGQASPASAVEIPMLADISRRHVKLRREGEAYVLEPLHATRIGGLPVQNKTVLSDGDEIELGNGVRLRFRQPHALSGSARLDFLSRHRTQPYADSVLLMAESCVLGPRWQNHVVCRDWAGDVVLYRQDDELYCRAMESIEIDGQLFDGRGRLDGNSHVVGSDFSMSLEELDRCSTQPLL